MQNKVLNDLLGYDNLKIFQDSKAFCFSIDSVLLANFVTLNQKFNRIIDLGTGNAAIPLILSTKKQNLEIVGVEIQTEIANLAIDSIKYNKLDHCIKIINEDIKNLKTIYKKDSFDVVIANPPYFKYNSNSRINESDLKTIARHEVKITFEEIVQNASWLLKENGVFAFVHRPTRLLEFLKVLENYKLEPKRIQFVYPKKNKDCNIILVECVKNGKRGLKILDSMYIHNDNGYTDDVLKIFNRK